MTATIKKIGQISDATKSAFKAVLGNSEIQYANTLFTSTKNADGTSVNPLHATCYKRERKSYVKGVKFATGTYPSHTWFLAFDSTGNKIDSYTLSGSHSSTAVYNVTFGDNVAYYSIMTLTTYIATSFITELINVDSLDIVKGFDEQKSLDLLSNKRIRNMQMEEWSNLQFGMFIHWGVYSVYGGVYQGIDIDGNAIDTIVDSEWLLYKRKIPRETYKTKAIDFSSDKWNPEAICKLAQSVGMKYVTLTIRHHEGFSLVKSDFCDWDIRTSSASADIVMQLKKACDRHHLKFCIYVSALMSWTDNGGYPQELWNGGVDPYTNEQHAAFIEKQCKYMNQLVAEFDPYIIWYDGGSYVNITDVLRSKFYENQLKNYPLIPTNSRGAFIDKLDFELAEDVYGDNPENNMKIERCQSLASWGYNAANYSNFNNLTSMPKFLWDIFEGIGRGFNYMLNISPKGNGEIPATIITWFENLATWCNKYTFFNGCKRLFYYSQPSWGRVLYMPSNKQLWLMIKPNGNTINLDSIYTGNIKGIYVHGIASPESTDNYQIISDYRLKINNIPTSTTDHFVVVRITYKNDVICKDYNIIDNNIISPISLVRTQYKAWSASGVTHIGTYTMGNSINKCVSRFLWGGLDGSYNITISATMTGTQVFTINVYDENNNIIYTNASINNSNATTSTKVPLLNGSIYKIELVRTDPNGNATTTISNIGFI